MITARLIRGNLLAQRTLGTLRLSKDGVNGPLFYTCEDTVRGGGDASTVGAWKIPGESAIPYGTYTCRYTDSHRFGRKTWEVLSVPGFQGIRIHPGNTEKHTEGCILLGTCLLPQSVGIGNSQEAVKQFEKWLDDQCATSFILQLTMPD